MDIRNIRTFIRVAELRSFTRVAEELNYVQSTVTMQIQQLERELGYPLFDRIGRKVSLTALGEEFLSYAYELEHLLRRASALNREGAPLRGSLRVGILESLLFGPMVRLLPEFRAKYPQLDLQLKMGQASELLQQLKQNRLDMVYLSAGLNTDPDLRCCYKRQERLVFLSGPNHPAAAQGRLTAGQLLSYDFVVTERSGICYGRLRELAARHNALLHDSVEVDSTAVIAQLLEKGMGLAFLPEYSVRAQLESGTLVRLETELEEQTYYSQILCHRSRWVSPFMAGLIEAIGSAYPGE